MLKKGLPNAKEYTNKRKKRSLRQRLLIVVASMVVFCTTYAMILPAITMESNIKCTKQEHIHKNACYGTEKELKCQQPEGEKHIHEENCYESSGNLICDISTDELHTHTDSCYINKMVMVCGQNIHQHSEECYGEQQSNTQPTTTPTEAETTEIATSVTTPTEAGTVNVSKDNNTGSVASKGTETGVTDLAEYIKDVDGGYIITKVCNQYGEEITDLSKVTGEGFVFSVKISSGEDGILPGIYQYTIPEKIYLPAGQYEGTVSKEGDNQTVGDYTVKEAANVVITIEFNDSMNSKQNVIGYLEFDIGIDNGGEKPKDAEITKTGAFNEADGMFDFKISAVIPAQRSGLPMKEWCLHDYSEIEGEQYWGQNLQGSKISISYNSENENGQIVEKTDVIPELSQAENDDNIAYVINKHDKKLYLVNRCRCISATCNHWDSDVCYGMYDSFYPEYEEYYDEWCTCWNLKYNATLTIEYKNNKIPNSLDSSKDLDIINNFGGLKYINTISLTDDDETNINSKIAVDIPKLITKTLPEKFTKNNNFMGTYKIVVNESKIDLSNVDQNGDKKPDETILIQDIMTNVGYIPGTLTITSSNPDVPKLEYGRDYEIECIPGNQQVGETYTATLNITLKNNKFNADSEIKNALGPYTYTIEYDAQAISTTDEGIAARVRTVNKATIAIAIYGFPGSDVVFNTTFAQGWSYLRRGLTIHKFDLDTSEPLAGAVFGLYTQDGTLIATGEPTGDDGNYTFSTDVRKGIIFKEDIAYYVAELGAPEGYNRVNTPHWFYFADEEFTNEELQMLKLLDANIQFCGLDGEDTVGIPNEKGLVLPETGGNGAFIYIATGLILLCIAAYGLYKKFLFRKEATF